MTSSEDPYTEIRSACEQFARSHYVAKRHQVFAALALDNGALVFGMHLEATVGRASICAEATALGQALMLYPQARIETVVAVRWRGTHGDVVAPCGLCRELLTDYAPDADVVVPYDIPRPVPLGQLLPHKYVGTKWTK